MESRAIQLRRMFDEAHARRAERPTDVWSVYNIARGEQSYWRTMERACADYLAGEIRPPSAPAFFAPVESQLEQARREGAEIGAVVREFENELGLRATK